MVKRVFFTILGVCRTECFKKKGKNSNAVSFTSFLLMRAFLMLWSYYMLIVISTGTLRVLNHVSVILGSRDIKQSNLVEFAVELIKTQCLGQSEI